MKITLVSSDNNEVNKGTMDFTKTYVNHYSIIE